MKKLFVLTMALMAICLTAQAQGIGRNWTEASQSSFQNVINRMQPVGTSYAITPTPITILEFHNICWGSTNTRLMTAQEKRDGMDAIKDVGNGFPNESVTFTSAVNNHFDNWNSPYFKVATKAQIKEGHRKEGLHGERSHASTQTRGFYVVMSYSDWQRLKTN